MHDTIPYYPVPKILNLDPGSGWKFFKFENQTQALATIDSNQNLPMLLFNK